MENQKEMKTQYADNVELDITKIEVDMNNYEKDKIAKVRLVTSKGVISWKPKVTKIEDYMGLEKKSETPMGIEEFAKNEKTSELIRAIKKNGFVTVVMDYSVGTVESEEAGEEKTYRWIRFISQWEKITVLKSVVEETKIE